MCNLYGSELVVFTFCRAVVGAVRVSKHTLYFSQQLLKGSGKKKHEKMPFDLFSNCHMHIN